MKNSVLPTTLNYLPPDSFSAMVSDELFLDDKIFSNEVLSDSIFSDDSKCYSNGEKSLEKLIDIRTDRIIESLEAMIRLSDDRILFGDFFKRSFELTGSIIEINSDSNFFVAMMQSNVDNNKRNVRFYYDEISDEDMSKVTLKRRIVYSLTKEFVGGEKKNVSKLFFLDDSILNEYSLKKINNRAESLYKKFIQDGISKKPTGEKR